MRRLALLSFLTLAGCGEAVQDNHFADDVQEARPVSDPARIEAVPVRVGELGPSFPACNAVGVTRNLQAGDLLPVREAPFEAAREVGQVAANGRFFICARSHDQKWFGIVFDGQGSAPDCGVAAPVASRRNYEGSCSSGWVSTPFVKLIAGASDRQQPQQ